MKEKWHNETCVTYTVKVWSTGSRFWYMEDGTLGRLEGPAVEHGHGTKEWWINNQLHRIDGPAHEGSGGKKEWWLHGKKLTEEEWESEKACL